MAGYKCFWALPPPSFLCTHSWGERRRRRVRLMCRPRLGQRYLRTQVERERRKRGKKKPEGSKRKGERKRTTNFFFAFLPLLWQRGGRKVGCMCAEDLLLQSIKGILYCPESQKAKKIGERRLLVNSYTLECFVTRETSCMNFFKTFMGWNNSTMAGPKWNFSAAASVRVNCSPPYSRQLLP